MSEHLCNQFVHSRGISYLSGFSFAATVQLVLALLLTSALVIAIHCQFD